MIILHHFDKTILFVYTLLLILFTFYLKVAMQKVILLLFILFVSSLELLHNETFKISNGKCFVMNKSAKV